MTQDTESAPEEVASFCAEADTLVREGRPDEAIRRLNFALDSMRNKDVPRAQARVLEAFARVHRNTGQMEAAESSLRAALACYLKLEDRGEEARLLGELASLRISQGELEDGGYWLHSSLRVLNEVGNRSGQAELHRSLAALHLRKGELELAQTHAKTAVDIFIDLADELGEARALGVLAQIHMRTGNYAAAHADTDRSLDLFRKHGHRPGASSATMISAAILRREGRLAEAERLLIETRDEKHAMHDVSGEAGVLNTLGITVMDGPTDRLGEAERHFLRAIELYNELNDSQNAALSQTNLAQLYQKQGRGRDAETVLRDAIKLHRRTGARESEMRAVRGLGGALSAQGKLDEAQAAYAEACTFARDFGDTALLFECLSPLADLHAMRGKPDEAAAKLQEALKAHTPPFAIRVVYAIPPLIRAALVRRDVDHARMLIREAEQALGQLSPETRAGLRATLDAAISATEAATSEDEWPLFHGYRPTEFSPDQRKALMLELKPTETGKLKLDSPAVFKAMRE
jgi:tetratricopeptide (TPR) repeat protein